LSYYEEFNGQYKNINLTINLPNQNNKNLFLWIGISLGIICLACVIWFIYKKKYKNIPNHANALTR
jgi:cytochrome c-type biogenesis protein CcmH/NrfF